MASRRLPARPASRVQTARRLPPGAPRPAPTGLGTGDVEAPRPDGALIQAVAALAAERCQAARVEVFRVEAGELRLLAEHRAGGSAKTSGEPAASGTLAGRAWRERRTARAGGAVATPLPGPGGPVGVLVARRSPARPFSSRDVDRLETIAAQAALHLQRQAEPAGEDGRLAEALEQQAAIAEILAALSRSPTNLQPVLETVARAAARFCGAPDVVIVRVDGDTLQGAAAVGQIQDAVVDRLGSVAALRFPVTRGSVSGRCVVDRRVVSVPDLAAEPETEFPEGRELQRLLGHRAVVAAPLLQEGLPLGAIVLFRMEPDPFSPRQLRLLSLFADQAAIAIHTVSLTQELAARNAELTESLEQQTASAEILQVISRSPTDLRPVLDSMAESAARLCEADDASIFRLEGDRLVLAACHGSVPGEPWLPVTPDTVNGRAVLELRPISVSDLQAAEVEYPGGSTIARQRGVRTFAAVPLQRNGAALGTISLRRSEVRPFSQRQVALLQTFADQAVIAIENVRLFRELEARNGALTESLEQQTATGEILRIIARSPTDVQPVFDIIARNARRLCSAVVVAVFRLEAGQLHFVAHEGFTPEGLESTRRAFPAPADRGSAAGRSVLESQVVQIPDVEADPEYRFGWVARQAAFRSIAAVPLLRDGVAVGVITVRRPQAGLFPEAQVQLLQTFADQAVIAIENVRLFQELEAKNHALTETLEQRTATADILRAISRSPTDTQPVFDIIGERALRLCQADVSIVTRREGAWLQLVSFHGLEGEGASMLRAAFPMRLDAQTVSARTAQGGSAVHVADVLSDPHYERKDDARVGGWRGALGVPMLRDGHVTGVIFVARSRPGLFADSQVELLRTFADQAVIAVENVRLFRELEVRNQELTETLEQQTASGEILGVISSSPTNIRPVLDVVAESAARLCEAHDVAILLREGDRLVLAAHQGPIPFDEVREAGIPVIRGTANGRAVLDAATVHVADLQAESVEYPEGSAIARRHGHRTVLNVPLMREGVALGTISLRREEVRPFGDRHVVLLQTFAEQAVIAIENVRLFQELEARNRDLTDTLEQQTATADILRVISSSPTDPQPVFDTIARNAVKLCDAAFAYVFRFDGTLMHVVAHHNLTREGVAALERQWPMRPDRRSVPARAVLDGRVVHVADVLAEPDHPYLATSRALGIRTMLTVPMLRDGQAIGAVAVYRQQVSPFSEQQIRLVATFADQAVIAIENVRLFQELEARNGALTESLEQQTATAEILRAISRSPTDVQPVFDIIGERAIRLCQADVAIVTQLEEAWLRLVALHGLEGEGDRLARQAFPMRQDAETVSARAARTGTVVHVADVLGDLSYEQKNAALVGGLRGSLGVPMLREGQVIGIIFVARRRPGLFADSQVELLQTFADQAVIAIENVRLFTELEARNQALTESLEQQTATGEILRVISSSPTDVQPVFDTIVQSAVHLCGGLIGAAVTYDGREMRPVAMHNYTPAARAAVERMYPMPAGRQQLLGRAILDRDVAHVADVLQDSEYRPEVAQAGGWRGALAVPMLRDGQPIGAILVTRVEAGLFSDRQVSLLKTFADQAVIAVENVRLFTELEARNQALTESLEQQTATGDILRVISSSPTDVQPVFDSIAESAARLCGARFCFVFKLDHGQLHFVAHHGLASGGYQAVRAAWPRPATRDTAAGRSILDGRVAHIPDVQAEPGYGLIREAQVASFRATVAVPMLREGTPVGTINVAREVAGPFSPRQIELLQTFAAQAVIAVENVRLFQELEARTAALTRSVDELQALGEVSRAVSSTLDLEQVLETIVSRAVQLAGSQRGLVYEFDEAAQAFHARATHAISEEHLAAIRADPIRLGEGLVGRAGVIGQPVQVTNLEDERHLVAPQVRDLLAREGLRSVLAVPLIREGRLLGGLVVIRREGGAFSPEVVTAMETLAAQSVMAIQNARLFRETERQRQYSEALVETSPVAIVTMDLEGRVMGWNPGAERLFAYSAAEAQGRRMEELVATPETLEDMRANIRQTLAGQSLRAIAHRTRQDGTRVDVEIASRPVTVDGQQVGMIAIYHDITELVRARREAEAANEAKGAFLATMSHEIRTPLNAVIGMSGLLLNTPLADEQREYAEIVRQSGDALLSVINDILDFSKIEAGKLELESQALDVRDCVEGALDLVASRAAEKGLDLAYLVGDGVPPAVIGDVTRLRQVLLNLLSNAVKFTERGEVVLTVEAAPAGPAAVSGLTFAVRDTGIGIPPDRLDRLFQSFSQVDASTTRRYGGTGLGLAISRRLVELMGGRIGVTSQPGQGSEFRFTVPAPAAESAVRVRRDLDREQPILRGKRILAVDDNATNRLILDAHLRAWGMTVRSTGLPAEALAWVEGGERFDAGILDMHMPDMDGVALARGIRQAAGPAAPPLILFTSLGRHEARAASAEFTAYLHKPIKPSQLFDTLASVLVESPLPEARPGAARDELDPGLGGRHPLRILLAEDNAVNQKVALRLLGQMGYRADVAANGLEAIEAVARQPYDVVLMDVQMPELDGLEASREINRRWPARRPRLVAMTANAMQGDRDLCVAAGMDDYVSKPIRVPDLVAALLRCRPGASPVPGPGPASAPAREAAGGEPAVAAVDPAVFESLASTMGREFVAELVDTFVEDARELLAALRGALAAGDLDGFRRAAHSLKSNAQTLGAGEMAAGARELEELARAGRLEGTGPRVERLVATLPPVTQALLELRRDLSA